MITAVGVSIAAAMVAASASAIEEMPPNQFDISFQGPVHHFSWDDVEDRVEGVLIAPRFQEGGSARLSFDVKPFQGKPIDGPAVVTLSQGEEVLQSETLARDKDGYHTELKFRDSGPCTLRIGFTTTHRKVISSFIVVDGGSVPRIYWLVFLSALALGTVGWNLFQNQQSRAHTREKDRERIALLSDVSAPVSADQGPSDPANGPPELPGP